MKTAQFDSATNSFFTAEISGPSYSQRIEGAGYFVIINPDSKHVSFSKHRHDICFGDIVSKVIPNYTNADYIRDYGSKIISVPSNTETDPYKMPRYDGLESMTVAEYLNRNVFRHDKSNCS